MPHARMGVCSPDAAQNADVVGANAQGATLPVGQPARERVKQRERRDVFVVKIACLVPEGAHVAAGHPTVARDDQPQLVFASSGGGGVVRKWHDRLIVVDGGDRSGFVVPVPRRKFEPGGNGMGVQCCACARARARLSVGGTQSAPALAVGGVKGFGRDCSYG